MSDEWVGTDASTHYQYGYEDGVAAERERQPQIVVVDGAAYTETHRTVQPGEWVEIHYSTISSAIESGEDTSKCRKCNGEGGWDDPDCWDDRIREWVVCECTIEAGEDG